MLWHVWGNLIKGIIWSIGNRAGISPDIYIYIYILDTGRLKKEERILIHAASAGEREAAIL